LCTHLHYTIIFSCSRYHGFTFRAGTFGPPHDRERNVAILAKALTELPQFTQPGMIRDLQCHWASDGSRSWEEELRAEMRREH